MKNKKNLFVPFLDKKFEKYCIENFDFDGDGKISAEEALKVTKIDCSFNEIESLDGLEYFSNLTYLNCSGNEIKGLCIKNEKLEFLDCSLCDIDYLCVRHCPNLKFLNLEQNPYDEWLDLHCNTQLEELYLSDCGPIEVLVYQHFNINSLNDFEIDDGTGFTRWIKGKTDYDNCPFCMDESKVDIEFLPLNNNPGGSTSPDAIRFVDKQFELYILKHFDEKEIGYITNEQAKFITRIECPLHGIMSFDDLQYFPNLKYLNCSWNFASCIDLSPLHHLEVFISNFVRLTDIKIGTLPDLKCFENAFNSGFYATLDFRNCPKLERLAIQNTNCENIKLNQSVVPLSVLCNNDRIFRQIKSQIGQVVRDKNYYPDYTPMLYNKQINLEMDMSGMGEDNDCLLAYCCNFNSNYSNDFWARNGFCYS